MLFSLDFFLFLTFLVGEWWERVLEGNTLAPNYVYAIRIILPWLSKAAKISKRCTARPKNNSTISIGPELPQLACPVSDRIPRARKWEFPNYGLSLDYFSSY